MNDRQENKLNMYHAVEQILDDNAAIIASVAAFQTATANFKAKIAQIVAADQQKSISLKGIAVDKNVAKRALAQKATGVARLVSAYASATANNILREQVKFSDSALLRKRDDQIAQLCQNIRDAADDNAAALLSYGVTPAMLADLQTAIDDYAARVPAPRAAVSTRATLQTNLAALFKAADDILINQLDDLLPALEAASPDFAETYRNARELIDQPSTAKPTPSAPGGNAGGNPT